MLRVCTFGYLGQFPLHLLVAIVHYSVCVRARYHKLHYFILLNVALLLVDPTMGQNEGGEESSDLCSMDTEMVA